MPIPSQTLSSPDRDVFSISRLVRESKAVLEGSFPLLWVEGEISNLARPGSGHWYFTLKDEAAQVRCAMFRMRSMHVKFRPENGQRITARVRVSLYEARGEYQLIVEHMEEAGAGALQRQFEVLKNKLAGEGLFDQANKQALPALPNHIGVITSPTGAAVRDILSVLKRRFPSIPVTIYPVQVQGTDSAPDIAKTIKLANKRKECDVLLLSRGGGSLEDLWAFNAEVVARAIAASKIPIVSGVGHEVDFTMADFVADLRAPTPTAAAELITPDRYDLLQTMDRYEQRLQRALQSSLGQNQQRLNWLQQRLQQRHPGQQLKQLAQRSEHLQQRLIHAIQRQLSAAQQQLETLNAKLQGHAPAQRLAQLQSRNQQLEQRLQRAWQNKLQHKQQQLLTVTRSLNTLSPLATLERGYSIAQIADSYAVITHASQVSPGDKMETRLAEGRIISTVDEVQTS